MSDQRPQPKRSWFARLREWLRPSRGDTIVANVQDSRDVIVGKNIIKVGTLVVPAVPVFIGVVVLILLVATGAYLYFVPDKMPEGPYNVAVAEFGVIGADKHATVTSDSQTFSRLLFENLRSELTTLSANQSIQPRVWHDSMFPTQIRKQIGLIAGDTWEQRQQAAQARASDLGANVLIFGSLDTTVVPANFTPEFYVEPLVGQVDEIAGAHRLGSPISVLLSAKSGDSSWAQSLSRNTIFETRRAALARMTFGLIYSFDGNHPKALESFKSSLKTLTDANDQTNDEVLHYLIGREYLFQANNAQAASEALNAQADQATPDQANALRTQAQNQLVQVEPNLVNAESEFNTAKSQNSAYARAYYGLGSVYRLRAARQSALQRLDQPDFLNRAFEYYQTALNLAIQAREEQTEIKIRGALASTWFLQGEGLLNHKDWARASDVFDQAIIQTRAQVDQLEKNKQVLAMAEAYLTLGNAEFEKGIARAQLQDVSAARALYNSALGWYGKCWDLRNYATINQGASARCQRAQTQVNDWMSKLP